MGLTHAAAVPLSWPGWQLGMNELTAASVLGRFGPLPIAVVSLPATVRAITPACALRAERPAADNAARPGCCAPHLRPVLPRRPRPVGSAAFRGAGDRAVADCPAPAVFASIDRIQMRVRDALLPQQHPSRFEMPAA